MDFSKEHLTENFNDYDIIITTYDMVRRHIDIFKKHQFSVGVFDEAQMIKNLFSGRTTAVRKLFIQFKLCLTGTPIENHLGEFFSIMDFAVPGLLDSYKSFQKYISSKSQSNDYSMLIERTNPFILRRTKQEILKELPEKTEQEIILDMSEKQKKLYTKIINSVRKKVDDAYKTEPTSKATMIALTSILRLRQLCISILIDPASDEPSPKQNYLVEQLHELYDEGHSAIIFSQFRTYITHLEKELKKEGLPILKWMGKHHKINGKS